MARAEKRHLGSVDYIKAIAIVAVVLTHAGLQVGNPALTAFEKIIRQSWVDFQVPSFFLVAGFLYHRASAISWGEVGRRLQRILVPYLVASGLVIAFGYSGKLKSQTDQPAPQPTFPFSAFCINSWKEFTSHCVCGSAANKR